jgi:hypothetical protein
VVVGSGVPQRMDFVDVNVYMTKLRKGYLAKKIAAIAEEDSDIVKEILQKLSLSK